MKKLHILSIFSILALGQGIAVADVCGPADDFSGTVFLQIVNHTGHGGKTIQVDGNVNLPKGVIVAGAGGTSFTVNQGNMATLPLRFEDSMVYTDGNNQVCVRGIDTAQQIISLTLTDGAGNKIYGADVNFDMLNQNASPVVQTTFSAGKPYGFPASFSGGDAQIEVYTNGVHQSSK